MEDKILFPENILRKLKWLLMIFVVGMKEILDQVDSLGLGQ